MEDGEPKTRFAIRLGIPYQQLQNYLSGKYTPRRDVAERLAGKLGVRVAWLLYGEEPKFAGDLLTRDGGEHIIKRVGGKHIKKLSHADRVEVIIGYIRELDLPRETRGQIEDLVRVAADDQELAAKLAAIANVLKKQRGDK